ncbi:MAG TPA: DNA repair protein RadC [Thermoanaerobaculia bacterium]|nr:DNA repair protein RadC [Thermoanaerobaculia bacterium]
MTELIADLPIDERPRERMMLHGAATLSNAELIAILIGTGVRGKNAIQLARDVLKMGMPSLRERDAPALAAIPGIGPAKAARITAALEMSRRVMSEEPAELPRFDSTQFGTALVQRCASMRQERLGALFIDSRHRMVADREIFVGTVNHALVSTRDIIRMALLETNATAVVLYHNHPSGDPSPSQEDQDFTQKLQLSLSYMDTQLVDHLIIGRHRYCSLKEKGMLLEDLNLPPMQACAPWPRVRHKRA